MAAGRRLRVSLETKVMVAVLAVLVTLPALTLLIVDRRLEEESRRDADLALSTARGAFEQALKIRSAELALRFRPDTYAYDQRFRKILLELKDAPTMEAFLQQDVLNEYRDTEVALFVNPDGGLFAKARSGGPQTVTFEGLAAVANGLIRAALGGNPAHDRLVVAGNVYDIVSLPVTNLGRQVVGALVFGIRIDDAMLQAVRPPMSELMIVVGSGVAASTFKEAAQNDAVLRQLAENARTGSETWITVGGERFKPASGMMAAAIPSQAARYIVLSSVEKRLSAFEQTRKTLLGLSAVGILFGAVIVWGWVRRITRPLVDLRDGAEAVGRGDFSRRTARVSNDECGDLALAFNQMTASLQKSRAELERAMQQLRATQAQLIQSEKLSAVGQFVAGVAHELNNPLTAVVGYSELLQLMPADEKVRTQLDRIAKSAHRCHKIVHSLLSFARQHPPERKLVNLQTALEEVLEIMAYELRTSNISVVREFAPELPAIMADSHQLQQVFVNILGNARQAIEPVQREGRIVIRTRRSVEKLTIEFEDNGPGIRPEHLARLFDPFFTTKPVGKGTGLGLSLCYGIVQEHGGTITARSDPGRGATFTIELPVTTSDQAVPPVLRGGSGTPFIPAPTAASGKRVLVIDDEQWIRELASELLRADGYTVDAAAGGEEAMKLLGRQQFDVIVSDWKMPGLNGVRLYEHLRETDPAAAKRVLFMTGDVVSETFQVFLKDHELACLSKPFAIGEFRAAVAKVFGEAKA